VAKYAGKIPLKYVLKYAVCVECICSHLCAEIYRISTYIYEYD